MAGIGFTHLASCHMQREPFCYRFERGLQDVPQILGSCIDGRQPLRKCDGLCGSDQGAREAIDNGLNGDQKRFGKLKVRMCEAVQMGSARRAVSLEVRCNDAFAAAEVVAQGRLADIAKRRNFAKRWTRRVSRHEAGCDPVKELAAPLVVVG
jgi:hypothetical protein